MQFTYEQKEQFMSVLFSKHLAPKGFRSIYKGVPMANYENIKKFIDFTKYYVMFRGPRVHRHDCTTRKPFAHSFDVYKRPDRDTQRIRAEHEGFWRGVQWANNRSH